MKLKQLLDGLDIVETNISLETDITDIVTDSRECVEGCLFVAMPGTKTDGAAYAADAVKAGAAAVLCESEIEEGIPFVRIKDVRSALGPVSAEFYGHPSKKMKMIGVTGTNGKSTTTHLIKELIELVFGAKVGLIGTNVNIVGDREIPAKMTTPQANVLQKYFYEMVQSGCEYCVMEVSSHALALGRVNDIWYDVGIFTNLSHDHLDFHVTMENYRDAKLKLFENCNIGIFNLDDPVSEYMTGHSKAAKNITFSTQKNEADVVAKGIKIRSDSVEFQAVIKGGIGRIEIGIPGMFTVYNGLAAVACGLALGMELKDISAVSNKLHPVKGRMEVLPLNLDYTVLIDYAVTPVAMENMINSIKDHVKGRTVLLFGCGGDRDRKKRPEMGRIACRLADFVIVSSDNPRTEPPMQIIEDILEGMKDTSTPYVVIEDRRKAICWALDHMKKDDLLILMGKGHETYQEINGVRYHLDEREVVAEHLAQLNVGQME